MLISYFHFSFTVSDIEASIAFYRDVLGMKLVHTMVHDPERVNENETLVKRI